MTHASDTILIRPASAADIASICKIYGYYVTHTAISFEIEPPTTSVMLQRYEEVISTGAPYLVATRDDDVIGFAYAGAYKSRAAYRHTVEHSVYLAADSSGRGIGRLLLERLIEACVEAGFREMIATIAGDDNHASVRLHERCGFLPAGKLKNVGFKQGRWLDVTLLQKSLR
ncbi:Phosphinothricin N-acetyltransferase [Pararobbsia alpina]|uniref:GNAT family N-acetyltransferase n=1 Tax=Pararobbsia alpina TaxID=621374 RepID=UPI0039A496EF